MAIQGYVFVKDMNSQGVPGTLNLTLCVSTDDGVVQTVSQDFATPLTLAAIRTFAFNLAQQHNSQIASSSTMFILNSPA